MRLAAESPGRRRDNGLRGGGIGSTAEARNEEPHKRKIEKEKEGFGLVKVEVWIN